MASPRLIQRKKMGIEGLRAILKSQYHAALAMLRDGIESCPETLWSQAGPHNPYWRIVYHTLYYTHLFLQPSDTQFQPWELHQTRIQHMDDIPGPADTEDLYELPDRPPQTGEPYNKTQMLEYWRLIDEMLDDKVDLLDVLSPESGFRYNPMPKAEHQIRSIRHIQHHTAQLSDRLRESVGKGIEWVGGSPQT